ATRRTPRAARRRGRRRGGRGPRSRHRYRGARCPRVRPRAPAGARPPDRSHPVTTTPTSHLALILTLAFWRAAGIRALRTALVAAAPFLLPLAGGDWGDAARAA